MTNFYVTVVREDGSCTNYPGLTKEEAAELFARFTRGKDIAYAQYGQVLHEPEGRYAAHVTF